MGFEIISNQFGELADRLELKADQHANASADAIVTYFVANVAVDTGALQSTGRKNKINTAEYETLFGDESAGVDYMPYIEFGTSKSAAQPVVIPAAEQERPRLIDNLVQDLF